MYHGGKVTNKHKFRRIAGPLGRSARTKTPIFGMGEREGALKALSVRDIRSKTLVSMVNQYVYEHSEVFTDELSSYFKLSEYGIYTALCATIGRRMPWGRNIEGLWAQFRRICKASTTLFQGCICKGTLRRRCTAGTQRKRTLVSVLLTCSVCVSVCTTTNVSDW